MSKPIILNLYGGPGASKSTTAAGVFHKLKLLGYNCELVTEFAKHVVWRENFTTLKNQLYIYAKQHDRIFHLKDKVEVIITDSPTIMGLVYTDFTKISPSFEQLALDEFNREDCINMNIFIERVKLYNPKGRTQTEEEAKLKDQDILNLLHRLDIPYEKIDGNENAVDVIVTKILAELSKNSKN